MFKLKSIFNKNRKRNKNRRFRHFQFQISPISLFSKIIKKCKTINLFRHQIFQFFLFFVSIFSIFFVGYFLYISLFQSNFFRIKFTSLSSFSHFSRLDFERETQDILEKNFFTYDLSKLTKKLTFNLWLKKIKTKKKMPNLVFFEFEEFSPQLAVELGDFYLADQTAFLFKRAEVNELNFIPILKGITRYDYQKNPFKYRKWISNAIWIKQSYEKENRQRPSLKSIRLELNHSKTILDFILVLDGGNEFWVNGASLEKLDEIFLYFDTVWLESKKLKSAPIRIILNNQNHPKNVSVKNIDEIDIN